MERRRDFARLLLAFLVGFIAYWRSTNDCFRQTAPPENPMKAIKYCEYGPPDVLKLEEIEKPAPKDDEILVRVRAASLNAIDGQVLHGGLLVRAIFGLRKPKNTRFGRDFAGVVEAVGKNVTEFKAGDEVFGAKSGAVAQYVCVREERAPRSRATLALSKQPG